jgi:hypothetical protein
MARGSLQLEAKATVPSFAKAVRRTRKLISAFQGGSALWSTPHANTLEDLTRYACFADSGRKPTSSFREAIQPARQPPDIDFSKRVGYTR